MRLTFLLVFVALAFGDTKMPPPASIKVDFGESRNAFACSPPYGRLRIMGSETNWLTILSLVCHVYVAQS